MMESFREALKGLMVLIIFKGRKKIFSWQEYLFGEPRHPFFPKKKKYFKLLAKLREGRTQKK